LAKGVLAVSLFECTALFDGEADHQTHGVGAEDGSVLFGLRPHAILVISEDDDARFGAEGVKHLVFLNVEDAHGRNSFRNAFGPKGAVLREADLDVCSLRFYPGFFFAKTSHPCLAVWVTRVESREEGARTFALEIEGANVCRGDAGTEE
jgi:hypothetical protein